MSGDLGVDDATADGEVGTFLDLAFPEGKAPSFEQWGVFWEEMLTAVGLDEIGDWEPFLGVLEQEAAGESMYVKLVAECDEDHPDELSFSFAFPDGFDKAVFDPFAELLRVFLDEHGGAVQFFNGSSGFVRVDNGSGSDS